MFAGFGTADETNARFRYLLEQGQTGLSTAFDMPTLMGYDSDAARALGEVGREGVAIDTLADMEDLFAGIPLDEVTTSMTVNAPAAMVLAMYVCMARRRGIPLERARRHDPDRHPQGVHRPEGVDLPARAVGAARRRHDRVVLRRDAALAPGLDQRVPHPRGRRDGRAGARVHARRRLRLRRGLHRRAGSPVDRFAPRLSFFFNAHLDFFEEIAKYRAARRIWARELRERFGAREERSLLMRFHAQTAGVSLTAQQPEVNVVRTAVEALAAVLGGCQSLHTNSFDEAMALPTEAAATLALRTQQVLAHEVGVTSTADPLGGSWYVESLTDRLEQRGLRDLRAHRRARRRDPGDRRRATSSASSPTRRSATSSRSRAGDRVIVGVNRYVAERRAGAEPAARRPDRRGAPDRAPRRRAGAARLRRRRGLARRACATTRRRAQRHAGRWSRACDVYASLGEMCDVLRGVWGVYRETPVF